MVQAPCSPNDQLAKILNYTRYNERPLSQSPTRKMSESKGISLRRKKTTRPTISAPRQLSQPRDPSADSRAPDLWETQTNGSGTTNLTVPGEGVSRTEKTAELVKRRYSTRFAGGQPIQDAFSAPPMPNLPAQYTQRRGRDRSAAPDSRSPSRDGRSPEPGQGSLKVDIRALRDPNLMADKYVQSILADATESDIYSYQNDLQNLKAHASTDLQHNVYQNRTQFIKISKEADKLKTEMRTLRTLMSDLTSALGQATSSSDLSSPNTPLLSVAERKRANRSSVANLEAMWSTHLQTLWKRVEGSQKYLPALPGRHIILESQRWVELNAATWKPRRRVALVLLNDHLLVASEKKRGGSETLPNGDSRNKRQSVYGGTNAQQTTLIAERCWPLADVSLADISTSSSGPGGKKEHVAMQNAINIRAGSESFTYATSDTAEKAGLLVAFRKAQEDLRKLVAAEHGERERKMGEMGLLAEGSGMGARGLKKAAAAVSEAEQQEGDALGVGAGLNRSNSVLTDAEGRQQTIRSVEASFDTLDIDIALQRSSSAVSSIEKLRKLARSLRSNNAAASELILAKVDSRSSSLARSIARQLVQNSAGMEKTKESVSWLLRLNCEELARSSYLDARTETIRARTRQLPFTGSLPPYLHALAYVTFTLLLHTFKTFSASFPPASGSAVVKWGFERVEEFNGLCERQMSSVERGSELWMECLGIVKAEAGLLREGVGVDFRALVGRNLSLDVDERRAGEVVGGALS